MSRAELVDELYRVFSRYPLASTIQGCPCCVSETDQAALRSRRLKELTAADVGRDAFKAMTTWGTELDYKHFLPRILELMPEDRGWPGFSPDLVARKIRDAGFDTWPEVERRAIVAYFTLLWEAALDDGYDPLIQCELLTIVTLVDDVRPFLDRWAAIDSRAARLAELVLAMRDGFAKRWGDRPGGAQVAAWLAEPDRRATLERAFFAHADQDAALGWLLSEAVDALP